MTTIRIGTRGSVLALWQAETVARLITERGGPPCELVIIRTAGDEGPPSVGSSAKATFVKEIEDALLEGRVDVAVHSAKDLSAALPEGLIIGAALPRADPRDAILLPGAETIANLDALWRRLGPQPRIGTSSVRRVAQLRARLPRATFAALRGNVDTRLRKLDARECDACVLACAGLERLGLASRIALALPLDPYVPAPGQGIVAVEVRSGDGEIARLTANINDGDTSVALSAERAIVRILGAGCQMPLGAHATITADNVVINAVVWGPDGSRAIRETAGGRRADATTLGEAVARALLARGAGEILSEPGR